MESEKFPCLYLILATQTNKNSNVPKRNSKLDGYLDLEVVLDIISFDSDRRDSGSVDFSAKTPTTMELAGLAEDDTVSLLDVGQNEGEVETIGDDEEENSLSAGSSSDDSSSWLVPKIYQAPTNVAPVKLDIKDFQLEYHFVEPACFIPKHLPKSLVTEISSYLDYEKAFQLYFAYSPVASGNLPCAEDVTPAEGWVHRDKCIVCYRSFDRQHIDTHMQICRRCSQYRDLGVPCRYPVYYHHSENWSLIAPRSFRGGSPRSDLVVNPINTPPETKLRCPRYPWVFPLDAPEQIDRTPRMYTQGSWWCHGETYDLGPQASYGTRVFDLSIESRDWFSDAQKLLANITSALPNQKYGGAVSMLEDLLLFLGTIQGCTNSASMLCATTAYAKTHFSKSLAEVVIESIAPLGVSPQSEDDGPDFKTQMSWLRDNWKDMLSSSFFPKLSKLLGILVMGNICETNQLTFKIGSLTVIEPDLLSCHKNAFSLFDAVMDTVLFFVEKTYLCYESRSLMPMFMDIDSCADLDADYAKLQKWWAYAENGNLEKMTGASGPDFSHLLGTVGDRFRRISKELKGIEKAIIERKLIEIARIEIDFCVMKVGAKLRPAPFMIQIYGGSAMGKSTICEQIIAALMAAAGLDNDVTRRGIINCSSKWMDNWFSNFNVAIIDDAMQEKLMDTVNPCRLMIDIGNNCVFIAPKADLKHKGKVFVEPDLVIVTTNKLDLCAGQYLNCPYALQRRFNAILDVVAKDDVQNCSNGILLGLSHAKVAEKYRRLGITEVPVIEDHWYISRPRPICPKKLTDVAPYVYDGAVNPVLYEQMDEAQEEFDAHTGKKGKKKRGFLAKKDPVIDKGESVSLETFIQRLIPEFLEHRESQRKLVENAQTKIVRTCGHPGCRQIAGHCPEHPDWPAEDECEDCGSDAESVITPHFGAFGTAITRSKALLVEKFTNEATNFVTGLDVGTGVLTLAAARRFCWHASWMKLVPTPWLESEWFRNMYFVANYQRMKRRYIFSVGAVIGINLVTAILMRKSKYKYLVGLPLVTTSCTFVAHLQDFVKTLMVRELYARNATSDVVKTWRDKYGENLLKASTAVAGAFAIAKLFKFFVKTNPSVQGSAISKEEVSQGTVKVDNAAPNPWIKVERVSRTEPGDTTTLSVQPEQLENIVAKNLFCTSLLAPDGVTYRASCLFLTSNIFLLPRHYLDISKTFKVVMYGAKPETSGGKFRTIISPETTYFEEGQDLAICYSPTGGSFKDLSPYLDSDRDGSFPASGLYREPNGNLNRYTCTPTTAMVTNNAKHLGKARFAGGLYENCSINTFRGLCGAPLIKLRKGARIVGIHVGGIDGKSVGMYHHVSSNLIDRAISHFNAIPGLQVTVQHGPMPTSFGGVNFWSTNALSSKSPLRYLPHTSTLQYHGSVLGGATPRTNVREHCISDAVARHCNALNIYGPPKMKPSWFPFQKCAANMCSPSDSFPPDLVLRAVKDYAAPLLALAASPEWCGQSPLTEQENINGIPGKRYIDGMELKTAAGYPFSGKKKQFIVDMDDIGKRELTVFARQLVEDYEQCLRSGVRGCGIAKACAKDEVLPVAKKKCRIFFSSAFPVIFLARKYYLPVLRLLQMNPTISECAVGLNSVGPEWSTMMDYVQSKGTDRLIAGDYSKYDQTLPTQLLIASLDICCSIAEKMGYRAEDMQIMRALIGDLVYPYINFNGDLISLLEGGWISGVPMTVHVNGQCGALLMRIVFFHLYPEADEFRPCVALMTYGDDNIGSVAKGYEKFNIASMSGFLQPFGMTYTMPDKESELTEFLPLAEMEFLKRSSVYLEDLNTRVGALAQSSIFKSLHCMVKEKGDDRLPQERAGEVIDGALRDFFFHGRQVYEERQKQLQAVVAECDIAHFVRELDVSYDQRVAKWHHDYNPRSNVGEQRNAAEVEVNTDSLVTMRSLLTPEEDVEALN